MLRVEVAQPRQGRDAGTAPRTPKIQQHYLALKILERNVFTFRSCNREVRRKWFAGAPWILNHFSSVGSAELVWLLEILLQLDYPFRVAVLLKQNDAEVVPRLTEIS